MASSRFRRTLTAAALVAVGLAWFAWLRPVSLGGAASYVIVQGGSMEPTYEDGDLVVVREADHYGRGDVIAFRAGGTFDDPTRIIHRIVGDADDGAFATQGDNRDQIDPWEPGPDDIIGRAVLHVPMAGDALRFLAQPAGLAALGGAAVVVGGERRRRRRRTTPAHRREQDDVTQQPEAREALPARSTGLTRPRWAFVGLVSCAALAVPVLAVAWSALRAPDSTQQVEPVGFLESSIGFDYRFIGDPSAVYPSGEVTAARNAAGAVVPDGPLYSRLLEEVEVELGFRVVAEGAASTTGTYAVDVTVESPGGWSSTITTVEPTPFDGAATETVTVDLQAVAYQVAAVADLTGVGGSDYTIRVVPTIDVSGRSSAGAVEQRVSAPLSFEAEGNLITANAVEESRREDLERTVSERATYSLGPWELSTQAARGLLGGLALVLVAGIAWFASVLFGGLGLREPDRIAARYRSQIVDVAVATAPPGPVVMVSAIDELVRIAKLEQTVIVHEDLGDGAHRYRVFLGAVTYEYETAPEHAGAASGATARSDASETGG